MQIAAPARTNVNSSAPPEVPGVAHKYVNVDGVRFHYAEAGKGEPLLLLHGFPENWYMWRDVIPELAKHYRVIAPDMRGSGWTDAPADGYRKEQMADEMSRFMKAVGAPRAKVMGHDMGGFVGFMLALRHPEQVDKYVAMDIISPWLNAKMLPDMWRFAYQPLLAAPVLGAKLIQQPWFVRTMLRAASPKADWSEADFAAFTRPLQDRARAEAGSKMYREVLREIPQAIAGAWDGSRLAAPTLLLLSEHDPAIRQHAAGDYLKFADDMHVEIVPGAGHFLAEENPAFVAARALEFFGTPDAAARPGAQTITRS